MKARYGCAMLLGLMLIVSPASAATRVFFDQDEYIVSSVGETFDVKVLIDADARTEEIEPVQGGLFSYGAEITFDPTKAQTAGPGAVEPVAELNHFGFAAGAFTEVDAGRAAGKGNIDQTQNPLVPYTGSLLMTVTLTNLAAPIDQYPLQLDFFRTLGANESLFLNGAGNVLDGDIIFEPALVRVVPEPSALIGLAAGIIGLWGARRRPA